MTQGALAVAMKVEQSTVCRWESGEYEPRQKHLRRLARVLKTTIDALVGA